MHPAKLESALRGRYGDEATDGLTTIMAMVPDKFRGPLAAIYYWALVQRAAHLAPVPTPHMPQRVAEVGAGGTRYPDKPPARKPGDGIAARFYRKSLAAA